MAKLVDVSTFDWNKYSPDDLVQKRRQFSVRASTPPGSLEKRPRYHLPNPRSNASAAMRIKLSRPSVIVASARVLVLHAAHGRGVVFSNCVIEFPRSFRVGAVEGGQSRVLMT